LQNPTHLNIKEKLVGAKRINLDNTSNRWSNTAHLARMKNPVILSGLAATAAFIDL